MSLLLLLAIAVAAALAVLLPAAWLIWRSQDEATRALAGRIRRLPLGAKLRLAVRTFRDGRIALPVRAIPPLLVLYLAMPIDIVPDFIPVLGQLDDVLIVAVGVGLLLRFTPRPVLEELVAELERAYRERGGGGGDAAPKDREAPE